MNTDRLVVLAAATVLTMGGVASGQPETPRGYVIRNVTVVDVENARTVPNQVVTVVGDRIGDIAPAEPPTAPGEGLGIIDGSGLHLLPGLFDAHVHLSASVDTFAPMLVARTNLAKVPGRSPPEVPAHETAFCESNRWPGPVRDPTDVA